jgi:hypothetical protein
MAGTNLGADDTVVRTQSLDDGVLRTEELDDGIDRKFTVRPPDTAVRREPGTFLDGSDARSATPEDSD